MYTSISSIITDSIFLQISGFPHSLHLKLESLNPAGSIKLKTACGLVDSAFARGLVRRDTVFIESSSGNLGVALAMICAERGLNFTCVIDPNCSSVNESAMRAFGASIVKVTEKDSNGGYLGSRISYIERKVAEDPRHLWLNQYENLANPEVHSRLTAASIARSFDRIDYLFVGAGTTGTLMGCLDYFCRNRPETRIVAVDSIGSVTFGSPPSPRYIPGLGTSQLPAIFSPGNRLHAVEMIPEAQAVLMCRHMARHQGVLIGGSTGTVLAGVHAWRDRIADDAVVVAISPDWGDRYLATVYDDIWVTERFGRDVLSGDLTQMSRHHSHTLAFVQGGQPPRRAPVDPAPFLPQVRSAV